MMRRPGWLLCATLAGLVPAVMAFAQNLTAIQKELADIDGEADEIAIFKGYSSSLMRPTAFDPDVPILPEYANILAIDRLVGPLNPTKPEYIQQGLTWETIQPLLEEVG